MIFLIGLTISNNYVLLHLIITYFFLVKTIDTIDKLSEQKKTIGEEILEVLDQSVKKINEILEKKDINQKRLKLSQVKDLKLEINSLIEFGKDLFSKAGTKEEKENVLEQILVSIDYLFAKIKVNKVFIRHPSYDFSKLLNLPIPNQLIKLMKPFDYNLSNLDSIVGGNCYSFIITLYHSILKEVIGLDKDINIRFNVTFIDYHSFISINDKYYIDLSILGESRNLYNIEKDGIKDNFLVIEALSDIDNFVNFINTCPRKDIINISVGGKKGFKLKIQSDRTNNSFCILLFKRNGIENNFNLIGKQKENDEEGKINLVKNLLNNFGIDILLKDGTFEDKYMNVLDLEIDRIILKISEFVTSDEIEKNEIISAFSKYDKYILLKIFSGLIFKNISFNDNVFEGTVFLN